MEIYLKDLKQNEQVAFIKFITSIREEYKIIPLLISDSTAFRFLRSQEYDIQKAIDMLMESTAWRKTMDWKSVVDLDIEIYNDLLSMVKMGYYGEDAKGHPIRILQPQKVDTSEIFKKVGPENLFKFQLNLMERLINIVLEMCSKKYNRHVFGLINLVDVSHLEVSSIITNTDMLAFAKNKTPLFQKNYPELTFKAIIINASPIFYTLWKIFSMFLKERTLERITICNGDYMGELLKITTIDKIPKCFGGTCPYEIDNYPNFYDAELNKSFKEKRLTLPKAQSL